MTTALFSPDVVWRPTPDIVAASNLARFLRAVGASDLQDLRRWSQTNEERFWQAVVDHLEIEFYSPCTRMLDTSAGIEWAQWCVDGCLNIVHNCIDRRRHDVRPAIKWEGEDGTTRELSYQQLAEEVNRTASALRRSGIKKGDV